MKGVVSVAQGRLRGVWRGDLWSFSGIPYGRAPIGALRWRPPLEAEGWSEIRDASTFGPIAPQSVAVPGVTSPADPAASEPHSEDCLSLNIWTPALPESPTEAPGRGRPVMVFIHGGGFTSGSGSVFLYRGGRVGAQRRRRGRDHQLPARRAGLPGSPGSGRSRRAGRELGHTGSTECLAMGARQHRGLWRRSGRRHHLRGVRRRVQRGDAARDACRQRPLPAGHRAERGRACARAVRRGTVGRASGVGLGHRVVHQGVARARPRHRACGRHRRAREAPSGSGHDAASFPPRRRRRPACPTTRWPRWPMAPQPVSTC